ncbi:MAG TPA: hypothetical protein VF763_01545 [Candidatus Limnocylindrales bacterium]
MSPVAIAPRRRSAATVSADRPAGVGILAAVAGDLGAADIERLAAACVEGLHRPAYVDALLAARRAAEQAGVADEARQAAERLALRIVDVAAARCPLETDEGDRWRARVEAVRWAASDAARALVVAEHLTRPQLRALLGPWQALLGLR